MPRQKAQHVDDPKLVGERLRTARQARGLSQRELSFPGCTPAYISRIEAGERIPSLQLLREFARRLGVSSEFLATGEAETPLSPIDEAELLLRLGDVEQAEALFESCSASPDPLVRARGESGLAQIAYSQGRLEEAIDRLRDAQENVGPNWLELAGAAETLVRALALSGRLEEAIATAEQMLRELPDDQPVARERAQMLLANAYIDNGSFERASEILGAALSREDATADPMRLAQLLWSQSRLHTVRGDHELAASYARRALGIIELTEHFAYAARGRLVLAFIENERGESQQALDLLERGSVDVSRANDPYLTAVYRIEEARALAALGRADKARELAIECLSATEGLGPIDAARASAALARVLATTGEDDRALQAFEAAAEQLERFGSPLVGDVYKQWSDHLDQLGRRDDAYEVLRRAVASRDRHRA